MKLLDTLSLALKEVVECPEYAVLSSTCSSIFDDQNPPKATSGPSASEGRNGQRNAATISRSILQGCREAQTRNVSHLWTNSLCVDHSSSAEIAESVTASFNRIWSATICIVYLEDLAAPETTDAIPAPVVDAETPPPGLEEELSRCRWFRGIWELQDLAASRHIAFFDQNWNLRCVKSSTTPYLWLDMLARVSGVEAAVLADRDKLFDISLGRRLSWASGRFAIRPEDAAYALAGICGIGGHMAPRYGEGGPAAFRRLQIKILKTTTDLSILAWQGICGDENRGTNRKFGLEQVFSGILADSPDEFRHFASNPAAASPFQSQCEITFNNRGMSIRGPLVAHDKTQPSGNVVLVLNWSTSSLENSILIGIKLQEVEPGLFLRKSPWNLMRYRLRKDEITIRHICVWREIDGRAARQLLEKLEISRASTRMDDVPGHGLEFEDRRRARDSDVFVDTVSGEALPRRQSARGSTMETTRGSGINRAPQNRRPSKRSATEMIDPHLDEDPSSSDGSSEDDILLFDSLPEKPVFLDADHPFCTVLSQLVDHGLKAWRDEKTSAADCAGKEKDSIASSPSLRATIGPISIPIRQRKRARTARRDAACADQDDNPSYMGETDSDAGDMIVIRPEMRPRDPLVCPFYRLDPLRHRKCLCELDFPDTRSVKQHIIVDHRLPQYCPVCYCVFESAVKRDAHIVLRSCLEPTTLPEPFQGVSETQIEEISQRGSRKQRRNAKSKNRSDIMVGGLRGARKPSTKYVGHWKATANHEEERWFELWDMLFPHSLRPASARSWTSHEREVESIKRFWRASGPVLVTRLLKEHGMFRREDLGEEAALAALHSSVLDAMLISLFPS
jgi:hypothetical protein